MDLPHDAVVLVADGRKLLFLRNEGDARFPNLVVEQKRVDQNPKDSDQKTDAAGRSMSAWGGGGASGPGVRSGYSTGQPTGGEGGQFAPARGTMGETDFHQQEEDRFAAEAAALLNARAQAGEFETLIVVAPPRALGAMRPHYDQALRERLAGEVAKDLTGHTVPQIEAALTAA